MNAYESAIALERRAQQHRALFMLVVVAIAALIAGTLFIAGDRHRAEIDQLAAAGREFHIADSISRALAPRLAHVDTLIVHDTVKVRVAIERVATLRDTVLSRLTDTVLVKEYIARTDTALKACSELSNDCAQFRAFAIQKFAVDSEKFTAFRASIPRPPRFGFKSGVATATVVILSLIHFTR